MKKVRTLIAAASLASVLLMGTSFANAGIIIAGATDQPSEPCTQTKDAEKTNDGIIVTDLTGIIIAGFTGIIIAGLSEKGEIDTTDKEEVNCGIIIAG